MHPVEGAILGHSHLNAILAAYDRAQARRLRLHRFSLADRAYDPILGTGGELNAILARVLAQLLAERPVRAGFLSVHGNAHTLFALVKHPRPFDFVLEENPDLPLDPSSEVVPEAFVEAALRLHAAATDHLLAAIVRVLPVPLFFLESPPPIRADSRILRAREPVFWDTLRLAEFGVAPAFLRLKVWRLHSRLTRRLCERHGVRFVPVPAAALQGEGFLVEEAIVEGDSTHGNAWYGARVLEQLEALAVHGEIL